MDPADLGFIKGAIAFVLLASSSLTAYWLRLRARSLAHRDPAPLDGDHDALLHLRADLEARFLEIEERLDFAERRLLQAPPRVEPVRTPRSLTPV